MKLKSLLKTDFVPILKTPTLWICPETLRNGSLIEVDEQIGYQLLAGYPGAFQLVDASAPTKGRKKTALVKSEDLRTPGETVHFELAE